MIKQIVKDLSVLSTVSTKANVRTDREIIENLVDTAKKNFDHCLGLAAIQIGYAKRIIIVRHPSAESFTVMVNPIIIKASKEKFVSTEGCLSLVGTKDVIRHREIYLHYMTSNGNVKNNVFSGNLATIIQHEIDHCNGILI